MVFVTVGTQRFPFNRLLVEVDRLKGTGVISGDVFAQIGHSDYRPLHMNYIDFLDRDEFDEKMSQCDIVITHGGTGSIMNAVKMGKKVIAVPRLKQYGEHIDDHQMQIVGQFVKSKIIVGCQQMDGLEEAYMLRNDVETIAYSSCAGQIISSIDAFCNELKKGIYS